MPIALISWDLDGTLYSTARLRVALAAVFCERAGRLGWRRTGRDWREFSGMLTGLRKAARGRGLPPGPEVPRGRLERDWLEAGLTRAGPRPDLRQVLELAASRIPQVVFSDFKARRKLEALGLEEFFDRCYIGEDLGFKPDPRAFRQMARDFGIEPRSILHVGDRVNRDGRAAQAAGCACVLLGRDFGNYRSLLPWLARQLVDCPSYGRPPAAGGRAIRLPGPEGDPEPRRSPGLLGKRLPVRRL